MILARVHFCTPPSCHWKGKEDWKSIPSILLPPYYLFPQCHQRVHLPITQLPESGKWKTDYCIRQIGPDTSLDIRDHSEQDSCINTPPGNPQRPNRRHHSFLANSDFFLGWTWTASNSWCSTSAHSFIERHLTMRTGSDTVLWLHGRRRKYLTKPLNELTASVLCEGTLMPWSVLVLTPRSPRSAGLPQTVQSGQKVTAWWLWVKFNQKHSYKEGDSGSFLAVNWWVAFTKPPSPSWYGHFSNNFCGLSEWVLFSPGVTQNALPCFHSRKWMKLFYFF